jgi:hypothetical protein
MQRAAQQAGERVTSCIAQVLAAEAEAAELVEDKRRVWEREARLHALARVWLGGVLLPVSSAGGQGGDCRPDEILMRCLLAVLIALIVVVSTLKTTIFTIAIAAMLPSARRRYGNRDAGKQRKHE